jgi:hypothetical protein
MLIELANQLVQNVMLVIHSPKLIEIPYLPISLSQYCIDWNRFRKESSPLDRLEVPRLRWLVRERLEVVNEPVTKVAPIVNAVGLEVTEPLEGILP